MRYTDDPAMDAENFYNEGQTHLHERPKCEYCGRYIDEETCYEIDGNIICDDCIIDYLHNNCRVKTEEVI